MVSLTSARPFVPRFRTPDFSSSIEDNTATGVFSMPVAVISPPLAGLAWNIAVLVKLPDTISGAVKVCIALNDSVSTAPGARVAKCVVVKTEPGSSR